MNKIIYEGVIMDPDSKSTKEPSHHHIITRSLQTMYFCDGIIGKITKYLMLLYFCDDFDIIYRGMWENSILCRRILSIMKEHIYSVKALLPDVLSESDYLPVYAGFQSQIAFCSKNHLKKQAAATLKNSKHKQARWVTQIL